MSTIYSAGQYDDAFCPRKLGNWEAGAKESYPNSRKFHDVYRGSSKTEIIVDSRGHLFPWVPRDKTKTWGLLNYFMNTKYAKSIRQSMAMMSGPGRHCPPTTPMKFKRLPKFTSQKTNDGNEEQDILLEYLQDLGLPIVWIIGPPTKNTCQKRKFFAKQLAKNLGFGYVNLDEKIHEWKERQATCTCHHTHFVRSACSTATSTHSLASTSIAPSKLPTNVSPKISSELPVPPETMKNQANSYSLTMLDSQRIAFDTALPMERNKILELYKFAMAECLPCEGYILDSVPFDLVEGLAFEKIFYPSALAIYFTEGTPQNNKNPNRSKDGGRAAASSSTSKYLNSPKDERAKKLPDNLFVRAKSHKRLGVFSLTEGEKICKQFGSKTIRIINAEDVERDTMEFLNELVKRNLEKYERIIKGESSLWEPDDEENIFSARPRRTVPQQTQSHSPKYSPFISEGGEEDENDFEYKDERRKPKEVVKKSSPTSQPKSRHSRVEVDREEETEELMIGPNPGISHMPPALITADHSEASVMTSMNFGGGSSEPTSGRSATSSLGIHSSIPDEELEERSGSIISGRSQDEIVDDKVLEVFSDKSAELWEKITKLETKVAELSPEGEVQPIEFEPPSPPEETEVRLPPPTAYAKQEEDNRLTTAIRNAMVPNFVSQDSLLPKLRPSPQGPVEFDYGAGGDCGDHHPSNRMAPIAPEMNVFFKYGKPASRQSSSSEPEASGSINHNKSSKESSQEEDSFYDT